MYTYKIYVNEQARSYVHTEKKSYQDALVRFFKEFYSEFLPEDIRKYHRVGYIDYEWTVNGWKIKISCVRNKINIEFIRIDKIIYY